MTDDADTDADSGVNGFWPVFCDGATPGCRRRGWYVADLRRSTRHATVFVGGRHVTRVEAQSEARRLDVDAIRSRRLRAVVL